MGFGTTELLVIAFIGLVLFGPAKLSSLGKTLGETIGSFKAGIKEAETAVDTKPTEIKAEKEEQE